MASEAPSWLTPLRDHLGKRVPATATAQELLPFQMEAVQEALECEGRFILGHEMGLGKTAMALAIVAHYQHEWPVLVVAPPVLLEQWSYEITRWLPQVDRSEVQVIRQATITRQKNKVKETKPVEIEASSKFVLVSYSLLVGQNKKVPGQRWNTTQTNDHLRATSAGGKYKVIIVDEAHALKAHDSLRTRTLLPMLQDARRAVLMTGTPMANSSAADVLPLLQAVAGRSAPKVPFTGWCEYFCDENRQIFTGFRWLDRWMGVNAEREEELHSLLRLRMARKLKREVMAELPPKQRVCVALEVTERELKRVRAQQDAVKDMERAVQGDEDDGVPTHELMRVFKLLAEAKQKAVCDWLDDALLPPILGGGAGGGKVIIFAHHLSVHGVLHEHLEKQLGSCGGQWVHVTGTTSSAYKDKQLAAFRDNPRCRVALLAVQACGAGLNLNQADTVVFAELCWTPSTLEQAEARVHRMGQQRSTLVYYLTAGGLDSPDAIMFNALNKKADAVARVVDGAEARGALRGASLQTPKRRPGEAEDDDEGAKAPAPRAERKRKQIELEEDDDDLGQGKKSVVRSLEPAVNAVVVD